jgi:hypothetical protein
MSRSGSNSQTAGTFSFFSYFATVNGIVRSC